MAKSIVCIGDQGEHADLMLSLVREAGFSPFRIDDPEKSVEILTDEEPAAIFFSNDIKNLGKTIVRLREISGLASVPMILRAPTADPKFLKEAFRDGVDDFIVDCNPNQFKALMAVLAEKSQWNAVRAPVGKVILAHNIRSERIKMASVLRKNGFDTHFASISDEITIVLNREIPRAVIVDASITGTPIEDVIVRMDKEYEGLSWIVIVTSAQKEKIKKVLNKTNNVRFFDAGDDAEGLTFLMNELLMPAPKGSRRSERILYGSPAIFTPEESGVKFDGYIFNINLGGAYIRTLSSLPLQTRIETRFVPPYGRGDVVVVAQVVWRKLPGETKGAASPPGMGIQFVDMWPADKSGFETGYDKLLEKNRKNSTNYSP